MELLNLKGLRADDLYFTADLHIGHGGKDGRHGILKLANRPFEHVDDMHSTFVENWNAVVPDDGIVFVLGDVVWKTGRDTYDILASLNGRKVLVCGNHEMTHDKLVMRNFEWVKHRDHHTQILDYKRIDVEDEDAPANKVGKKLQTICMLHYPIASWEKKHVGGWMLHGHSHNTFDSNSLGRCMDVGVDTSYNGHQKYTPYSYAEVKRIMSSLGVVANDHHH